MDGPQFRVPCINTFIDLSAKQKINPLGETVWHQAVALIMIFLYLINWL